jgi:hypothetical protein
MADKMILSSYLMIVFMILSFLIIERAGDIRGKYGIRRLNAALAIASIILPIITFFAMQLLF